MILRTDARYWSDRYAQGYTGWDIGYPSTPLRAYIDQISDPSTRILVPGAGYGHEVRYLVEAGYQHVTVVDIAPEPMEELKRRLPPDAVRLITGDLFDHVGDYDLILEQTFFCAIDPSLREQYVAHSASVLRQGGLFAGVLFDRIFDKPGPPHGGSLEDYARLFDKHYAEVSITPCQNSIPERQGQECFIVARK